MTKKEYCLKNEVVACYSNGFFGVEIHGIEYGLDDYLYCSRRVTDTRRTYHKLKIHYGLNDSYVRLYGRKISMSECIRIGGLVA